MKEEHEFQSGGGDLEADVRHCRRHGGHPLVRSEAGPSRPSHGEQRLTRKLMAQRFEALSCDQSPETGSPADHRSPAALVGPPTPSSKRARSRCHDDKKARRIPQRSALSQAVASNYQAAAFFLSSILCPFLFLLSTADLSILCFHLMPFCARLVGKRGTMWVV